MLFTAIILSVFSQPALTCRRCHWWYAGFYLSNNADKSISVFSKEEKYLHPGLGRSINKGIKAKRVYRYSASITIRTFARKILRIIHTKGKCCLMIAVSLLAEY